MQWQYHGEQQQDEPSRNPFFHPITSHPEFSPSAEQTVELLLGNINRIKVGGRIFFSFSIAAMFNHQLQIADPMKLKPFHGHVQEFTPAIRQTQL
ncbi:hypothetical protein D3C75_1193080 [compost metagenome]